MRRILWLLVAFPGATLLVALAVANRHAVRVVLDPFRPEAPAVELSVPLYICLLGALFFGILLGGFATWLGQSRYRRVARVRTVEAKRWQAEADRLTRERDRDVSQRSKQIAAPRRDAA